MIRNFFLIAWRNVWKHKTYAGINVLGLSLGIACGIFIFSLVTWHFSFDAFHPNKDRIYRIVTEFHDEIGDYSPGVPSPVGRTFRKDFDFAEQVARVVSYEDALITVKGGGDQKKFEESDGVAYTEPAYFNIFDFPLLRGNKATALQMPEQALITEKLAKKYFGSADAAMGKTIRVNNKRDFAVTGILKDIPVNTDRKQEIYLSYVDVKDQSDKIAADSSWGSVYSGCMCFVLLKPSVRAAQVNHGLLQMGMKYQDGRDAKETIFRLQPLRDIHFNPNFDGYVDKKYLWALAFIGIFIIITACVNFVNLATAQALNRSTEVGIRKVLGGLSSQLFWQFITETFLIALFAVAAGYLMVYIALPYLNQLFSSNVMLHPFGDPAALIFLVVLLVTVTFLSGAYPGLVLSRFKPVAALKSRLSQKQVGGFNLRRILVITQFAISQTLIIATVVIASQLHFALNADLGFDRNAIVMLQLPQHNDPVKLNTMRTSLEHIAGVRAVSFCYNAPAADATSTGYFHFDNRKDEEHFEVNKKQADDRYLSTFGLKLAAGRNFFPADTGREFVVNETMVKRLQLRSPADILGKQIHISRYTGQVVGVVKDFFNASMHSEIAPIAIYEDPVNLDRCAVKIDPAHMRTALAAIQGIWNGMFPDYIYSYKFLDDNIADFYGLDKSLMMLIEAFSVIAVLIGCLGLYGLTSFMALRKTKEIGIRKVLGAGVPGILWLFGREFSRLLFLAFMIAAPVAWCVMHQYLQDFRYRITIGPGIFLLSIAATLIIVVLTVSYQSLRSATANPVKSLRSE
jgi:putative ABC transport system permease protein